MKRHRVMVSEDRSKFLTEKTQRHDRHGLVFLLDLLARLKFTNVTDRIRVATETLYQELINAEASAFIGAAPFERTEGRSTHRDGTRARTLTTTAGELDLGI